MRGKDYFFGDVEDISKKIEFYFIFATIETITQLHAVMSQKTPLIVSIEGNIGAGKSTLIERMKKTHESTNLDMILTIAIGGHVALYVFFFKILQQNMFWCYIAYTFLAIFIHIQVLLYMDRPQKNIVFVQEPVNVWERIIDYKDGKNILQKYGENPEKYAFTFQMMCLLTRIETLGSALQENPHADVIVCERSVFTDSEIFARMLYNTGKMDELQYKVYRLWLDSSTCNIPKHEFIYLRSDPAHSIVRKEARNRAGEENIHMDYMNMLHIYHEELFCGGSAIKPFMTVDIDSYIAGVDGTTYKKLIHDIFGRINTLCTKTEVCNDSEPTFMQICGFEGNYIS